MSLAAYKWNHHIYWDVLCTFVIDGEVHKYIMKGLNQSYTGSLEDAKKHHVWGNHPTFEARVVGIRFS